MDAAVLLFGICGLVAAAGAGYILGRRNRAVPVAVSESELVGQARAAARVIPWIIDVGGDKGWWSEDLSGILGLDPGSRSLHDEWRDRLHPEDRKRILGAFRADSEQEEIVQSYRLRHADGSWLWIASKGGGLRDESGRRTRYAGMMTKVSERRRFEFARGVNSRLIEFLDAAPISVAVSSMAGTLLYCNRFFTEKIGIDGDKIGAVDVERFYDDIEDRRRLVALFAREGGFRNVEVRYRAINGRTGWGLSSWSPIEFDGAQAILSWHYDITDRRQAEIGLREAKAEAERTLAQLRSAQETLIHAETMASLGELVASVSHEVSTPLGIGVTAATYLAEQVFAIHRAFEDSRLRKSDMAEFLVNAGEGTQLLVANLLRADELINSFKQVAVDRTSGERREFDMRSFLEEVLFSLRPRLKRAQVRADLACPEGVSVDSYPGALSQVITNLVINALVHAFRDRAGGGTVRIALDSSDDETINLSVADDGVGIPPEHLSHVFEPFFTTRRKEGGSGLGLHIVHNLITRRLGGDIRVESEPGRGTTFTIRLHRVAPGEEPGADGP